MCARARRRRASCGRRSRFRRTRVRRRAQPSPRDARLRAKKKNSSSPPVRRSAAQTGSRRAAPVQGKRTDCFEQSENKDRTTVGENTSAKAWPKFLPHAETRDGSCSEPNLDGTAL